MIHLFFVPGMFGSTIEYAARNFSNELTKVAGEILPDGSMHDYKKQAHFTDIQSVNQFFTADDHGGITTPIYPFRNQHFSEILECFKQYTQPNDCNVLIHANDLRATEINLLFQWYKIAYGSKFTTELSIFVGGSEHNVSSWNPEYQSWRDMQPWEIREWLSLLYTGYVTEWIDSQLLVDSSFLKITNTEMLASPLVSVRKIFSHCNLTETSGMEQFFDKWSQAQQYIVDEFELLDRIIDATVSNESLAWQRISIISEAIVQQRLRAIGYEIRCSGLNIFPTNSKTLYNLLEKV